jgi:3-amino-5-hydroxybenzoic acid synthesis related protein
MKKVICFDFDGVIINSRKVQYIALKTSFQQVTGSKDEPPYEDFFLQSGNSLENIFENLKLPLEMIPVYQQISIEKMDEIEIHPQMAELIRELNKSGYRCALCTGKDRHRTLMILEKLKILKYFDMVVCSDDVSHPKPDPESLNLILNKLGADLKYSVMIGDANNDVICAKSAYITSIGVTWGDVRKEKLLMAKPDYVVDTVDELRTCIAKATNESRRRNWVFENDMVCAESKCNLRCDYCLTETSNFKKEYNEKNNGNLLTEYSYVVGSDFKRRLDIISETLHKELDTLILKISGGEILFLPHINDYIMQEAKKYEVVQVLTNGVLLNDEMLDMYSKSGNIFLQISIDSNMLEGNFYRTKNNKILDIILQNLDKAYERHIPVEINCVLTDINCANFDQFAQYLTKYDSGVIIFPFPVRGALREKYYPKKEQLDGIQRVIDNYDYFSKIMAPRPYMEALINYLFTDKRSMKCYLCECSYGTFDDGIITPCSNYWFKSFGNIIENPDEIFENIDNNNIYLLMDRKQHLIDQCKHCFTPWEHLNLYLNGKMTLTDLSKSALYNLPKVKQRIRTIKEELMR